MNTKPPVLRRRLIEEADLDAVTALLASGFRGHSLDWWRTGIERLRHRNCPPECPRYGRLLEADGRIVGVLLTIYAEMPDAAGGTFVRCNLSSWHVEDDFAGHAPLLLGAALRDKTITYVNITPARHTAPIIEAQGFRPFAAGSVVTVPVLARRRSHARVRRFSASDEPLLRDGGLVADHAALGCLCFVVEAEDGTHPFVFATGIRLRRFVTAAQLLYCRDIEAYVRFGRALGAVLMRYGIALAIVDGADQLAGMPGRSINKGQKKYVFGPHAPRPGDLAYTELAVFN